MYGAENVGERATNGFDFTSNHHNYNFLKCDRCIKLLYTILLQVICKVVMTQIPQCNRTVT